MADITQADVVVTQTNDDEDYSGQRYNRMWPIIAFGDGVLYYPTYGVPLPDIAKFRLKSFIKRLFIEQPANGLVYAYDRTVRTATPVGPYGTIRIFQGNGGAISGATFVGDAQTPTGNVATSGATSGGTPAGNVVEASHSHGLVILANSVGMGAQVIAAGANTANHAFVSNTATGDTIPAGNSANQGGVANTTPANATFTGAALATHTHTAGAFTGDAQTPTGNITGTVVVVGGALSELGHVQPAAVELNLEIIGA